ncbi:hypothetical protein P691DRAFT_779191 [Macrolepiota fuliginosa MF-IS2]|uniref:Uncharacterized protein n=1 Tax=Macrolepiota fuliginosa MF-IS2 TaxID=1400762 RepID=A0A9P5X414_9AGAR|nr:hypothetical protein P691DRAFT_779191 [Macrolepiota fuliginosa MF-IS2]
MSMVATLFAGVASTMLQVSIGTGQTSSAILAVNALWFSALIFSIGALLNNLVSMAWKGSEMHFRLPPVVSGCIRLSPAAFLILAVLSFSAGIVVFAFASVEATATSYFVIAATVITFAVAACAATWLIFDWVVLSRCDTEDSDLGDLKDKPGKWRRRRRHHRHGHGKRHYGQGMRRDLQSREVQTTDEAV